MKKNLTQTIVINYNTSNFKKDLDINKLTLRFTDKSIEDNFKKVYFEKSLKSFRISFITVIILYSLFGIIDYLYSFEFLKVFFTIRYLIIFPLLFVTFLLSFHKKFINYWQELVSFCYYIGGTGIIFMLHKNPENIFYYGGMFLIFLAGYFFIKLQFSRAIIPGLFLIITYNVSALFVPDIYEYFIENMIVTNAFYISANIISLIALYNIENLERKDFIQRVLLSEKQNEISSINQSLEIQVLDRTKLLDERNDKLLVEIKNREIIEAKLLKAKEKAEESDRLKSAFLANMSHEIRTPMNGILGFIGLLQDPEISNKQQKEFLNLVEKSSNRLLFTINDIIEISKIEAGQTPLNYATVHINDVLNHYFSFFLPEAKTKGIELIYNNPSEKIVAKTDVSKLESILSNLIKNALKFTEKGSIEFGYSANKHQLNFFVKDTGIGIPKERITAIFNRFEQADLSTSRGHEGSGLGLSIAKAYTEMLGGSISVESEVNKGTVFSFSIYFEPVQDVMNKNKTGIINTLEKDEKTFTILIAEDDEISLSLLESILEKENYNLLNASNGKIALDIFKLNNEIDIVLMDLKMHEMDGIETTKEIRKLNSNIPIIAQTAYALAGDKEKAIEAGCNDYISKPINKKQLLQVLNKYLQH